VSVGGLQKRLGRIHGGERGRFGGRFRQAGHTEQRERRANGRSALTREAHGTEREEGAREGSWRR
jgi:hypothetical protein